jgi:hypothetical protein
VLFTAKYPFNFNALGINMLSIEQFLPAPPRKLGAGVGKPRLSEKITLKPMTSDIRYGKLATLLN